MNFTDDYFSNVTCNCTFKSSTVCHVTNMYDLVFLFSISWYNAYAYFIGSGTIPQRVVI